MIITTTPTIAGKEIAGYSGVVSAEVIFGGNVLKDVLSSFRDFFGGRAHEYEKVFADARWQALRNLEKAAREKGCHAVVGVQLDYHSLGANSMMMVAATGTAVRLAAVEEKTPVHATSGAAGAFYVEINGAKKGPFNHEQIGELITQGKLSPTTWVEVDGSNQMVQAGTATQKPPSAS